MNAPATRYSETQDTLYTIDQLESMNLVELKELFNEESLANAKNPAMFKPIAKFSDKANAVRRVWATLTDTDDTDDKEIEADDTDDNTVNLTDIVTKVSDDFRSAQVTCATCGHSGEKRHFDNVGAKWYCSNEEECQARLNPTVAPNEHNAPAGMVYCGICKQHVPADSAEPTSDDGIYQCKVFCLTKSLKGKAKAANAQVKERKQREPKERKERTYKHASDHLIKMLVASNPKKTSSAAYQRFEKYVDNMTVSQALTAGLTREDLAWDVKHGFISICDPAELVAE